jgi:hypothetical protein
MALVFAQMDGLADCLRREFSSGVYYHTVVVEAHDMTWLVHIYAQRVFSLAEVA